MDFKGSKILFYLCYFLRYFLYNGGGGVVCIFLGIMGSDKDKNI